MIPPTCSPVQLTRQSDHLLWNSYDQENSPGLLLRSYGHKTPLLLLLRSYLER